MSTYLPIDPLTLIAVAVLFVPMLLLWAFTEINSLRERRRWAREWQAVRDGKAGSQSSEHAAAPAPENAKSTNSAQSAADGNSGIASADEPTVLVRG